VVWGGAYTGGKVRSVNRNWRKEKLYQVFGKLMEESDWALDQREFDLVFAQDGPVTKYDTKSHSSLPVQLTDRHHMS
jgi:hypothetical protein